MQTEFKGGRGMVTENGIRANKSLLCARGARTRIVPRIVLCVASLIQTDITLLSGSPFPWKLEWCQWREIRVGRGRGHLVRETCLGRFGLIVDSDVRIGGK